MSQGKLTAREAAKIAAERWSGYTFAVRVSSHDANLRFVVGLLVLGHKSKDDMYRLPLGWGRSFEAALASIPEQPGGIDLRPLCMVHTDGTVRYADGRPDTRFDGAPLGLGARMVLSPVTIGTTIHRPEGAI